MNLDNICFTEQLTFLKYVNEHYLFYTITIITFASLFSLVWILKKYTYFEKHKVSKAAIPTFPYGNFGDVIKQENSLHVFLWKHYNRFKRKGCTFGGLFLFMKPVILSVDSRNDASCINISPYESKLQEKDVEKLLKSNILAGFIDKFNYAIKGALPEQLLKTEVSIVLKDFLLESVCLAFGFEAFEMVEEINQLLNERYPTSVRYYLSLCCPLIRKSHKKLNNELKEMFVQIMEKRKKNDLHADDLLQSFIELYNESGYAIEDFTTELFNIFADFLTYSYSSLLLCLYELAQNDEILEEVLGEIRRFNKKNKKLSRENLKELIYIDAVVKETLRKYPPIATVIKSSNGRNDTDLEWCPEKNSLIFQSVLGVHRDPQFYTKPEAFEPDRFTEKLHIMKDTFIPFGSGSTSHLYMEFISLQMKLILVSIFSCLQVKMKDGGCNTFKYNPGLLYLSPCDLSVKFTRI